MSVLGWVLVGVACWVVVSGLMALVVARLIRANCVSVLDVLPERHRRAPDPLTVPSEDGEGDGEPDGDVAQEPGDLPAPRSGAHDEARAAERRRPSP
ncbi:hypothetical protein [Actinomycetospora sp. NBC_00405]|uniref:hypothetical protein n=1 Tax=Actinomycetospora sp. NBC_00405 TaxID=2975952 RepID=UPI002E23B924